MKRPLIWFSLSFILGIYCCSYAAKQLLFCGILFFLICLSLSILHKSPVFLLLLLFFGFGVGDFYFHETVKKEEALSLDGQTVSFCGTISNTPKIKDSGTSSYQVSLSSINGTSTRLKLWMNSNESLQAGDVISGEGQVFSSDVMIRKEKGFGEYLSQKGFSFSCTNPTLSLQAPSVLNQIIYAPLRLRGWMISYLDRFLSPPMKGILIAISTGDRSFLSSTQKDIFLKTGASHILAVSGLHVTILLFGILALLNLMGISYPLNRLICLPVPLFLALFMGGQASVLRACIMGFLFLLADCVRAESDSINSLFLAAFFILLFQPNQLFEAGFLLSFCSTFGIVAFLPVIQAFFERIFGKNIWLNLVYVSVSSYLTSILILICFYHQLPLAALAANMIVVPLFPMVLAGIFLFVLTANLFPVIAPLEANLLEGFSSLVFSPLEWLAKLPLVELATPNRFLMGAYCFLIVFFYLLSLKKKQFFFLFFTCFCLMMSCIQQFYFSQHDSLTVLQEGCIHAVIIQTEQKNTLVMAGVDEANKEYDYDYNKFLQYFQENNIQTIDVFCFMNYNKGSVALFRDLGKTRTINQYLIPSDQRLWKEASRIGTKIGAKQAEFSQPYAFLPDEHQSCTLYPEGKLLWHQNSQLIAEISKKPSDSAQLTVDFNTDHAKVFGIPYSHQQYGTMRFLIKNGNIIRLLPEYCNEQEELP